MNPYVVLHWLLIFLEWHGAQLATMTNLEQYVWSIDAPSPAIDIIPSELPTSTVTVTQVSFTTMSTTSTQYSSPPSSTTESTATFSPSNVPEPVDAETLAPPTLAIIDITLSSWIAIFAALAILLAWLGYCLGRSKSSIHLTMIEAATLSSSESTADKLYDILNFSSLQSAGTDADRDALLNIALLQCNDSLQWRLVAEDFASEILQDDSRKENGILSSTLERCELELKDCKSDLEDPEDLRRRLEEALRMKTLSGNERGVIRTDTKL